MTKTQKIFVIYNVCDQYKIVSINNFQMELLTLIYDY